MKTIVKIAGMTMLLVSTNVYAQHAGHGAGAGGTVAPEWTNLPMILADEGFSRSGAKFQAYNMHAMNGASYASYDGVGEEALNAATQKVEINETGALAIQSGSKGGYYLIRVTGHGPAGEETTATTLKFFANPGPAPRDLLNAGRPGFEIAPKILPREHGHYRENETWAFIVREDGQPVRGLPVALETSNGTKAEYTTDDSGVVKVTFPQDYKDIPKDQWVHGDPPSSKFVVAVRNGGLLATYNDNYNRDAFAGKSLLTGVGFAMLGMIAAVPLVRRRNGNKG